MKSYPIHSGFCPKCKNQYPNVEEYFYVNRTRPNGFAWKCKKCSKEEYNARSARRGRERRSLENKKKDAARSEARHKYENMVFSCAVVNCLNTDCELHHVDYNNPLAVIPLCKKHHKQNHDVVRYS